MRNTLCVNITYISLCKIPVVHCIDANKTVVKTTARFIKAISPVKVYEIDYKYFTGDTRKMKHFT